MKFCSICNQTYTDDYLNFCLNDGGALTELKDDDAPPTLMFKEARKTQENWNTNQTESPWQNQPMQNWGNQPLQQNQPFYPATIQGQNQTLPSIALSLGICSIVFGCCYGGIPFGAAALVLGFLGLKNNNENPMQYGGRSLAIGGIVTGIIGLLISLGIFLIAIIANAN